MLIKIIVRKVAKMKSVSIFVACLSRKTQKVIKSISIKSKI